MDAAAGAGGGLEVVSERVRTIIVTIEVDTNKRTITRRVDIDPEESSAEAIAGRVKKEIAEIFEAVCE